MGLRRMRGFIITFLVFLLLRVLANSNFYLYKEMLEYI